MASLCLARVGAALALLCILIGFGFGMVWGYVTARLLVATFIPTLAAGGVVTFRDAMGLRNTRW